MCVLCEHHVFVFLICLRYTDKWTVWLWPYIANVLYYDII